MKSKLKEHMGWEIVITEPQDKMNVVTLGYIAASIVFQ